MKKVSQPTRTLYQIFEEGATVTDDLFAAFNAMDGEDRDMMIEALVIAARKWRRQAAAAREAEEMNELSARVKAALEQRVEGDR